MAGLPRSDKSTYTGKLRKEGWVRINPDEIRLALHVKAFLLPAEPMVWKIARTMAAVLLKDGYRVVIDATNVTRAKRRAWSKLARELGAPFSFMVIVTPLQFLRPRDISPQFSITLTISSHIPVISCLIVVISSGVAPAIWIPAITTTFILH